MFIELTDHVSGATRSFNVRQIKTFTACVIDGTEHTIIDGIVVTERYGYVFNVIADLLKQEYADKRGNIVGHR